MPDLESPTVASPTAVADTPTVFLVDDDSAVRDAVSLLLRASGLAVEAFSGAADVLAAVVVRRPGCLVLDVRMPGMSGLDVQQQLRANGCRMPIIFVTGYGDVPMALRAMKAGALDFIEKPFPGQLLLDRVHEALALDTLERSRQAQRDAAMNRLARLSSREREVLDRVAAGQYNKTIADELGISLSTVEIHRRRAMTKLEVESLAALIRILALTNGEEERCINR